MKRMNALIILEFISFQNKKEVINYNASVSLSKNVRSHKNPRNWF